MTVTTARHATSILESLGGVVADRPPNSIDVILDIGEGYSLRLHNSWSQNYIDWVVADERDDGSGVARGFIARLDAAKDDRRFAVTREQDVITVFTAKGPHDYRAIGRAFERLESVLGDWLVRDG